MKRYAIAALAAAFCSAAAVAQDSKPVAPVAPVKQEAVKPAAKAVKTDKAVKPAAKAKAEAAPATEAAKTPASGAISIEKMVTASSIENKDASGESTSFATGTDKVFCWMKISGPTGETVKHVWYAEGKRVAEVPLALKYSTMRTWSQKTVWPGSWKVEAVDSTGVVLSTVEFTVAQGEKAPKAEKAAAPVTK